MWYGIKTYQQVHGDATLDNAERKRINEFVKNNPNDKPHMHMHMSARQTATHLLFIGHP